MKAFIVESYGKDGLRAADIPNPTVGRGDVLIQIRAASINPLDKMVRNGEFKQMLNTSGPSFWATTLLASSRRLARTCMPSKPAMRCIPGHKTCASAPSPSTLPSTRMMWPSSRNPCRSNRQPPYPSSPWQPG